MDRKRGDGREIEKRVRKRARKGRSESAHGFKKGGAGSETAHKVLFSCLPFWGASANRTVDIHKAKRPSALCAPPFGLHYLFARCLFWYRRFSISMGNFAALLPLRFDFLLAKIRMPNVMLWRVNTKKKTGNSKKSTELMEAKIEILARPSPLRSINIFAVFGWRIYARSFRLAERTSPPTAK